LQHFNSPPYRRGNTQVCPYGVAVISSDSEKSGVVFAFDTRFLPTVEMTGVDFNFQGAKVEQKIILNFSEFHQKINIACRRLLPVSANPNRYIVIIIVFFEKVNISFCYINIVFE